MNYNSLINLSPNFNLTFLGSLSTRSVIANKNIMRIKLSTMIITTPMLSLPVVFSNEP